VEQKKAREKDETIAILVGGDDSELETREWGGVFW